MYQMIKLAQLPSGELAQIARVDVKDNMIGPEKYKLLREGARVLCLYECPLRDARTYVCSGEIVTIQNAHAALVVVLKPLDMQGILSSADEDTVYL